MLGGTAGEQIPDGSRNPERRRPDDVAILPAGDVAGRTYEELYVEHAPVARRAALSMVPRDVADDIVAEAFTRVLGAIRAGGGPGAAFRAYLLAAVRNTANDWLRASRRTTVVGDLGQDLEDRIPEENMGLARLSRGPEAEAEARAEARLVAEAFAHLPTRWRAVLWQLEVEGKAPAAIAPMFGLSANGVSALAVRAREGLRQAYLQEHVGANIPASCRSYAAALGADARGRCSRRRRSAVHEHLQRCTGCHALASELTELNSRLGAILTPAAMAGASLALASGGGAILSAGSKAGSAAGSKAAAGIKAAAGAKAGAGVKAAGVKAGAGIKAGVAREGARAWLGGHWRLLRLHPVTAAAGTAAGLAAAGGMIFAVSVAPAGPSPLSSGAARPATAAAAPPSSGSSAHVSVPGGASPLGSAASPLAPVSGVTGSARPAGPARRSAGRRCGVVRDGRGCGSGGRRHGERQDGRPGHRPAGAGQDDHQRRPVRSRRHGRRRRAGRGGRHPGGRHRGRPHRLRPRERGQRHGPAARRGAGQFGPGQFGPGRRRRRGDGRRQWRRRHRPGPRRGRRQHHGQRG